jgi:hypothetical protein
MIDFICRELVQGDMAWEDQWFQMTGINKHHWGVLLHKIQLLLELLEFKIQITGHPVLHNTNTWSLSQL